MSFTPRDDAEQDTFPSDIESANTEEDFCAEEEEPKQGVDVQGDKNIIEESHEQGDLFPSDEESAGEDESEAEKEQDNKKRRLTLYDEPDNLQHVDPFPSQSEGGSEEEG